MVDNQDWRLGETEKGPSQKDRSISRRDVFKAGSATVLGPLAPFAGLDESYIAACTRWLALDSERLRLLIAWSDHEACLARECDWLLLSEEARKSIAGGALLSDIDARLDVLDQQSDDLLEAIPTGPIPGLPAVAASLLVVERLLHSEDHPLAHGLISRAAQALLASIPKP